MKVRKGSLSYWILFGLEKTVDGIVSLEDFTYNSYKYMGPNLGPGLKKSSLSRAIKRLRTKGLITDEINEGKVILKLTNLGMDIIKPDRDEEWDGTYRIIIWDIPENKRRIRDLLRRRMKEWGFKSWQRSVWASKKNVTGKVRKLITDLGIEKWVAIVESNDPSLTDTIFHDRGV